MSAYNRTIRSSRSVYNYLKVRYVSSSNQSTHSKSLIGYVSDIEGDYQYWKRYQQISKVLVPSSANLPPGLKEGCQFVFGGDSVDKGGMDIAVLKDLLSLKERYPDRVHLVLGNRDINKIRFLHELTALTVDEHPGVYWTHSKPSEYVPKGETELDHLASSDRVRILKWMLACTMGCPDTFNLRKQELCLVQTTPHLTSEIEWEKQMSSPCVSDDDVANDFLMRVLPGGEVTQYLQAGQLALVIGDVLFLHGAVSEHNFGAYPNPINGTNQTSSPPHSSSSSSSPRSYDNSGSSSIQTSQTEATEAEEQGSVHKEHLIYEWRKCDFKQSQPLGGESGTSTHLEINAKNSSPLLDWVSKLNKFKDEQVEDFIEAGKFAKKYLKQNDKDTKRGGGLPRWMRTPHAWKGGLMSNGAGGALVQYGMFRDAQKQLVPGVVYASNLSDGSPKPLPDCVESQLALCGISCVVNGHQPFGDGPLVISHKNVRVLTFDTSYSNDTLWPHGTDYDNDEIVEKASTTPPEVAEKSSENTIASVWDGNGTRGKAVGEIVFIQTTVAQSSGEAVWSTEFVNIHGTLSSGEEYDYLLPPLKDAPPEGTVASSKEHLGIKSDVGIDADHIIGQEIEPGWWTRALLTNQRVLLSRGEGYSVANKICKLEEVREKLRHKSQNNIHK